MTMEALQGDLEALSAKIKALHTTTTTGELVRLIKQEIWPFIESHVAETSEMDMAVAELVNEEVSDTLLPETSAIFAVIIAGGRGFAGKVRELAAKDASGNIIDTELANALATYETACDQATAVLADITVEPTPDDEDDEDDDDEGDEDDGKANGAAQ